MKEIGEQFNNLAKQLKVNENAKEMENVYTKLNKIFTSWSVSCGNQSSFFKDDFKSFFNYIKYKGHAFHQRHGPGTAGNAEAGSFGEGNQGDTQEAEPAV